MAKVDLFYIEKEIRPETPLVCWPFSFSREIIWRPCYKISGFLIVNCPVTHKKSGHSRSILETLLRLSLARGKNSQPPSKISGKIQAKSRQNPGKIQAKSRQKLTNPRQNFRQNFRQNPGKIQAKSRQNSGKNYSKNHAKSGNKSPQIGEQKTSKKQATEFYLRLLSKCATNCQASKAT